eukprot:scaffold4472_cov180-Amphora_coffeaeformis.AAC.3
MSHSDKTSLLLVRSPSSREVWYCKPQRTEGWLCMTSPPTFAGSSLCDGQTDSTSIAYDTYDSF